MRLLLVTSLLFIGLSTIAQNKVDIQTSAICEMCQHAIEYELTYTKGVKSADLNLDNKVVTVAYNPKKISPDEIRKAITMVGYHADTLQRDSLAYEKLPLCCKDGGHDDDHKDGDHDN